jgi:hypothetical protein
MNILEAEDMVKGLPDQVLFQYAQNPPPQIPQFLAVSEVQRRQEMRQRFQAQGGNAEPTIKDQILQGGIASAGGPPPGGESPPMAPPGAAPPGAPMQQPMTGAPMPPMGMSDGGRVPGGNPQVFRDFMRRNFGTPQGIAANVGLVGGALLGGPIGAGIGGNLGTYVGQQLTPPAKPLTPFEMMRGGLRAPEGGAVGGGGGGGLPYGGPTSYASERSQLNNLINQFGDRKRPTVTVEEIPQGMYQGGQVPYRMQEGRTVPDLTMRMKAQNAAASGPRIPLDMDLKSFVKRMLPTFDSLPPAAQAEVLARFEPQYNTARANTQMFNRASVEDPSVILNELSGVTAPARPQAVAPPVAAPAAAPNAAPAASSRPPVSPGGIVNAGAAMADQRTAPPAGTGSNLSVPGMIKEMMTPSGITEQQQRLIDLIEQQRTQGVPAPLDLDPYRQAALQRQQEAKDEARRMAIAGTLTSLGAGVMGGDPAAGLRQATQVAMETLREGRREASAEGRTAEQLQLQAAQQQRQAQVEKMQFDRETIGQIANIYGDVEKNDRDRKDRAAQLFVTYDASVRSNLANASQQQALDNRAFLNAVESAEDRIEDTLNEQIGLSPEQKDQMRERLVERAIRQYGAMIPTVDVAKVLKLRKAESEKPANAQSKYQVVEVVRR